MKFDELLYNDSVLDGLYSMGFDECTPIQAQAIPPILEGRDLLGIAQTGTGKTAAYLLPVIDLLADGEFPDDAINCVVMAPTRELVMQIDQQLQGFAYFMPVSGIAIYGGTDGKVFDQQKRALTTGADVVIATPGRLIAHMQMGYVDLSKVSFFILDEADRMLDMGFYDDIMKIVSALPDNCQKLMFSATMPPKIKQMASRLLYNPVEVKLAISKPADNIRQEVYFCGEGQKLDVLTAMFRQTPPSRVIVFSSQKSKVKDIARQLRRRGFNVGEMHSDLDQTAREQMMLDFRANKIDILLATDIVARGIDIDDISLVVNYDVPRDAEDYVHRIGRTARAANSGRAATFVCSKERSSFARIEQLIEMRVNRMPLPQGIEADDAPSDDKRSSRPGRNRGRRDKPRSKKSANQKVPDAKPVAEQPQSSPAPSHADVENAKAPSAKKSRRRKSGHHRHKGSGKPTADQGANQSTKA